MWYDWLMPFGCVALLVLAAREIFGHATIPDALDDDEIPF